MGTSVLDEAIADWIIDNLVEIFPNDLTNV